MTTISYKNIDNDEWIEDIKIKNINDFIRENFQNLTFLDCRYCSIKEITFLPPNLELLDCENNKLIKLPYLPDSLTQLNCGNNRIKELPQLPHKLITLTCDNNKIGIFAKYFKCIFLHSKFNTNFTRITIWYNRIKL